MKIKMSEPTYVDVVYVLPDFHTLTIQCRKLTGFDMITEIDAEQLKLLDEFGIKYECC